LISTDLRNPYGKPNRPSTPVKGIISGDYAVNAEKDIMQKYE
jgi:hypothetical protein